jgi:DNA polymerase-3 subunit epsilon
LLAEPRPPEKGEVTLKDKPVFADIAQAFVDFIGDAKLVIHNAAFDMKFLNAELGWVNRKLLPMDQALDTLAIARKKFPGSPASLDALCRRFGIDNSNRTLHGALLDSEILAEVYLELIGGRQPDLVLAGQPNEKSKAAVTSDWRPQPRPSPLAPKINAAEAEAHAAFVKSLGDDALWSKP